MLCWCSDTKAEGTTSMLLKAADLAVKGDANCRACFDKVAHRTLLSCVSVCMI